MATLANFRTMIASELDLDNTAASAEQVEIDRRLNEAVRDFLIQTGVKVASATMTLTDGTDDYTLSADVLRIKNIYVTDAGQDYQLERVTPDEIIRFRQATSTASAGPVLYYALNGTDLLMVYPGVDGTLTIYYVPKPTEMSSDSHDPSSATYGGIPVEYHPALEAYALWKLASMDDDSSTQQGAKYRVDYERFVRLCRSNLMRKGGSRLPRAVAGRRRVAAHDPSTDL